MMTEDYLDITKSVMISSPAGSGKTEKLARRYIALLRGGSDVERILAITFTDKAAAEMKERILNILKKEDPEMFDRVREKMPRMRISTIHSFCLKLLKRFCMELGMDISLEVIDSFSSGMLWEEAVYESLLEDGRTDGRQFYEVIKSSGIKGWDKLYGYLKLIHGKRPDIEFGLKNAACKLNVDNSRKLEQILSLYSNCLNRYCRKKRERHFVDYNDLELMAFEAVSNNPEWQNVLYSFDEHTDHILVDEFQDTSSLQWRIIDKLTEEWRSGMGAKRDSGNTPTIFLVGDDKQSIYSFRGADSGIFKNVRKKLSEWLGDEYHFIEIKENYRSLPAVVNFANSLFGKLMPAGLYEDWRVDYIPFEATRQGEGGVELVVCEGAGNTKENRKAEAAVVADKIKGLRGKYEIYDGASKRKCRYGDMAVLLRNRTYLSTLEDALRKEGVPFIVIKGVGFYSTPEIGVLKNLLFFLIDPRSDYSLFNVLRSPLFSIGYDILLKIAKDAVIDNMPAGYLFESLNSKFMENHRDVIARSKETKQTCLFEIASPSARNDNDIIRSAISSIDKWIERAKFTPYAILLEEILCETGAWGYFHENQRHVNVKKFIRLVEDFESKGLSGMEIREKLIKASSKADESKANVNAEEMDAVKIMTSHAAKGLQFPMVFLPFLDEGGRAGTGSIVMDYDGNDIIIGHEEDLSARKSTPLFQKHKDKIEEEEKRLFYVSATRAMDYLCMSGVLNKKPSGKLAYMFDAFDLTLDMSGNYGRELPFKLEMITVGKSKEIMAARETAFKEKGREFQPLLENEPVFIEPAGKIYKPPALWRDVTEAVDDIRRDHGEEWVVLGRALHRIFEGFSKGLITKDNLESRLDGILKNELLSGAGIGRMRGIIFSELNRLDGAGYLNGIIMPCENSYSELPFILESDGIVYKGRIDRIIIRDNIANIYDYKTYPVPEKELPELPGRYSFQMNIYRKAVERLFSLKTESYLFLTHELKIIKI